MSSQEIFEALEANVDEGFAEHVGISSDGEFTYQVTTKGESEVQRIAAELEVSVVDLMVGILEASGETVTIEMRSKLESVYPPPDQ